MMLLIMVEVVLVLAPLNSHPQKIILEYAGMMGVVRHLSVSAHHLPWRHNLVGLIKIMILVIIHFVLVEVTVTVAWVI